MPVYVALNRPTGKSNLSQHGEHILHANLVQIFGKGVLITGKPGIGKSELTLNLLDRGHFFIADDLVSLSHPLTEQTKAVGLALAQKLYFGKLHIRDLGLIDIEKLYPTQILSNTQINFSVELTTEKNDIKERLTNSPSIFENIPHYKICVTGRQNLALLIEALVKTA